VYTLNIRDSRACVQYRHTLEGRLKGLLKGLLYTYPSANMLLGYRHTVDRRTCFWAIDILLLDFWAIDIL
jgi:hypothetical protein